MTVGELRERLATLDDAMLVVLSRDAEGNGYSPLSVLSQALYYPISSWSGALAQVLGPYPLRETVPALVLYPRN